MKSLKEKEMQLEKLMEEYMEQDVCVAFSGGVDSSLLLQMACYYGKKKKTAVYALTMDTTLHPKEDLPIARAVAKKAGACHMVLRLDELAVPEMENNPRNRCYLCKKALYSKMQEFGKEHGISRILDGTNEDDTHVYRPGFQAVTELGILSPLADCGITKEEVRYLAEKWGVSVAYRPSAPCLATRLPYGALLDPAVLRRLEKGEDALKSMGFANVRLRLHDRVLRIETELDQIQEVLLKREEILCVLKGLGFVYVTLDLEGFRSGSMDL